MQGTTLCAQLYCGVGEVHLVGTTGPGSGGRGGGGGATRKINLKNGVKFLYCDSKGVSMHVPPELTQELTLILHGRFKSP